MLTEEAAKTKWCPASRLPTANQAGGINRDSHGNMSRALCVGSGCMMWRDAVFYEDDLSTRKPVKTGFCGLAGRPE